MDTEEKGTVTISILEREYRINCAPAEEEALRRSARYLDSQLRKVKSRSSTLVFEKMAIMAALNISHELLQKSQQVVDYQSSSLQHIQNMEEKIASALKSGSED